MGSHPTGRKPSHSANSALADHRAHTNPLAINPTDAITEVIEKGIRPQVDAMSKLLRLLVGRRVSDQKIRRCASSILGQCLFYHFAQPAILQLRLEKKLGPRSVDALARHITEFSLAAMRGFSKTSK